MGNLLQKEFKNYRINLELRLCKSDYIDSLVKYVNNYSEVKGFVENYYLLTK